MNSPLFQFDLEAYHQIRRELAQVALITPLLPSLSIPGLRLKAENRQVTGSFKIRPAYAQLIRLAPELRASGVVTSSSGNFAQGAAYAATRLGVSMKVVMMRSANPLKIENARSLGADIVLCDDRFEARQETVRQIQEQEGRVPIFPYNHEGAVLGNATLGDEILDQYESVSDILVPVSGGGLLAGILVAAEQRGSKARVWGVQAEGSNATYRSYREGRSVTIDRARTIADGLTVTTPGSLTFPIIKRLAAGMLQVREDSILEACQRLLFQEKLLVEPSGAVPLAAVIEGQIQAEGTVCVLSGGNISPAVYRKLGERLA